MKKNCDRRSWNFFSVEHNLVVRYLVERHALVHEALVLSPKAWKMICLRADR
ncbi:MAG: hypothetical protein N2235_21055 [Fischerella sp.]|nr:hypothetical protein [Fischerella sp.]